MIGFDDLQVIQVIDHQPARLGHALVGPVGVEIHLFENGAIAKMETRDRVVRPAIRPVGAGEIAQRGGKERLFQRGGLAVPEPGIGTGNPVGEVRFGISKPFHQPRHRRQGDETFQLGEFLLQLLRHTLDQEIAE